MKAKLQTPRRLQGQEKALPSSANSISSTSSIRVSKKSNYSFTKNQRQSSSLKQSSRVESMLQDSQCITLRKQLENSLNDDNKNSSKLDFTHIETNQLNRLISHLREYSQHCAVEGKYDEARQAEFLGSKAKSVLEKRTTKIKPTVKIVEEQKESRSNFEQRWQNKFTEYENETIMKRERLQKKHSHETRVFERIWAQEMPQKYRKPSQHLLQLMQIEKSLAISGEIDRADYIHSQVVKQTQIEMENAQSNLIHDYQIARSKHLEKQSIEISRFEQTRNHGKDLLEADYKADMLRVNHRDLVVKVQVKESILKAKMDQTPPTRSAGVPKNRDSTIASLLPRLVAPNDPSIIKNEKMRKKQIYGKQQEFQRKTIETLQAESSSRKQNRSESNKTSFIDSKEKENLPNDIKTIQKAGKRRKKVSKNIQGTQNIDTNDYSENDYYYSDDANTASLYNDNGIIVNQNTKAATPAFGQIHYNSPMSSEQNGINNKNIFFESSATMFSDTYQKSGYKNADELKNSENEVENNEIIKSSDCQSNNQNDGSTEIDRNEINSDLNNINNSIEKDQTNRNDEMIEKDQTNRNDEIIENDEIKRNVKESDFNLNDIISQSKEANKNDQFTNNIEKIQSKEMEQILKDNIQNIESKENIENNPDNENNANRNKIANQNIESDEIYQNLDSNQYMLNNENSFNNQTLDTNDFDLSSSNIQNNIGDINDTNKQDITSNIMNSLASSESRENDKTKITPMIVNNSDIDISQQIQDVTASFESHNE